MKPKSNTLFHFTKTREVLQSILLEGFWPRYSPEDHAWIGDSHVGYIAYPMVCFCDIPLSRIDEHVAFYGGFGLGMTREWAVLNGLNPILYLAGNNDLSGAIVSLAGSLEHFQESKEEEYLKYAKYFRRITAHIKPAVGNMLVAGTPVEKEFYQESEWRYIPASHEVIDYLSSKQFGEKSELDMHNEKSKLHGGLKFVPNDIRYIFVNSDADIPPIMNFIQSSLDGYPHADIKVLMSRVTSLESVRRDW